MYVATTTGSRLGLEIATLPKYRMDIMKARFTLASPLILPLLEARDTARQNWSTSPSEGSRTKYCDTRRTAKKALVQAKEDWLKQELRMMHAMPQNPVTSWQSTYRIVEGLTGHKS
jgi:hypothetical protein